MLGDIPLVKEVIGVIHLPRTPSINVRCENCIDEAISRVLEEVKILSELGYSGALIENFGDTPFDKRVRDPLTIASLAVIIREAVKASSISIGVNILRNSGREAYAIAIASGAKFIRVNALIESIISDSGIVEPEAPRLKTIRLNYPWVKVYADIMVKHSSSLRYTLSLVEAGLGFSTIPTAKGSIEDYIKELIYEYIERGKADALIVTGLRTGEPPPIQLVKIIDKYSSIPVLVGSGITAENVKEVLQVCDGVIVGSYIKSEGRAGNRIDYERARELIERAKAVLK